MINTVHTDRAGSYAITVGHNGWIRITHYGHWGEQILSPAEAADIAAELVDAIRRSQDRNQINTPSYYSTEAIARRAKSNLGKAQAAVRRIFQ